jgi:hypothetical protein
MKQLAAVILGLFGLLAITTTVRGSWAMVGRIMSNV